MEIYANQVLSVDLFVYMHQQRVAFVGFTAGVPDTVMGLTFVAAGVSVPDALSSLAVVKEGKLYEVKHSFRHMPSTMQCRNQATHISRCTYSSSMLKISIRRENGKMENLRILRKRNFEFSKRYQRKALLSSFRRDYLLLPQSMFLHDYLFTLTIVVTARIMKSNRSTP